MTDRHPDQPAQPSQVPDAGIGADPREGGGTGEPARGRARPWIVTGAVLGALALGYVGVAAWTGGRVPEGTTIAGIDVGGVGQEEAEQRLAESMPQVLSEPVPVVVDGEDHQLAPQQAGLSVDVAATADRLTGFTLNPVVIYERLTGGGRVSPVIEVADGVPGGIGALATTVDRPAVDGRIELADGAAEVIDPVIGRTLERDGAVAAMADAWPSSEPIALPYETQQPGIDADALAQAQEEYVDPLLSGPVVLNSDQHTLTFSPTDLTGVSRLEPGEDGETLALRVDGEALLRLITEREPELGTAPTDARFEFQDGAPVLIGSETGMGIEPAVLSERIAAAATSTEERTAEVDLQVVEPEFTTAEAEAMGINEPIAEFATNITRDWERTQNLILGSQRITGVLVEPGEQFSLLEHLGPVSAANGYHGAAVISNGFTDEAVGGGLSQLSTNTYNAGFLAGMVDIEHQPHSRYYSRYPAGREATLWEGQIDMIWQNDTPYGVLVQAWVGGGQQHVRLWSTPYWEVNHWRSERYAITQPETRVNTSPRCEPEGPGPAGFTIDVFRERSREGQKVDEQSWRWTYNPWHEVECA